MPTFELVFFLTMEAFGKVHPSHWFYEQWNQMSYTEQKLHIEDMADLYLAIAKRYGHSAIFIQSDKELYLGRPANLEVTQWLLEAIREKSGDEYFIMMHGDPTWAIPNGNNMMDFSVQMYEEPEVLNEQSEKRLEWCLDFASKLDQKGHLLDGFALCSDYCFNTNPFFSGDQFAEFNAPYLKAVCTEYRKMGYVFATSNSVYTGMPLSRYEMMMDLWREYGNYDKQ